MIQPRLRKKIVSSQRRGRSPYVINLRQAESAPIPVEQKKSLKHEQRNWTSHFFQPAIHEPPRVDFAHGIASTERDQCVPLQMEDESRSETRFQKAFTDSSIGEIFGITGFARIFRHIHVSLPSLRTPVLSSLAAFVLVAFLLIAPIGVLDALERMTNVRQLFLDGKETLVVDIRALAGALQNGQWDVANAIAARLEKKLTTLEQSVDGIPFIARRVLGVIPAVASGENLIHNGARASRAFTAMMSAVSADVVAEPLPFFHRYAPTFRALRDYAFAMASDAQNIKESFFVPESFAAAMESTDGAIQPTLTLIDQMTHITELIDAASGFDQPRRYLILFQNPHEMRATGGFLGSYGILDIRNGHIESFRIPPEGTYGIKGNLTQQISSPEPLHLVNTRWQFQDANWWPDWQTSAEKILWFWRESQQPTVDGVIVVNGTVLEDVLRVLGPLYIADDVPPLVADSALTTIERIIEQERENENRKQPKRILGVTAAALQKRFAQLSQGEQVELMRVVWSSLDRREILLMSPDPKLAHHMSALHWDGKQKRAARDYLRVVHANVGGGKSDGVMENAINHALFIQPDGTAIATVTIDRTHRGVKGDSLTGRVNSDYLRVYVPQGSTLIDAWGFTRPEQKRFERFVMPDVILGLDADLVRIEQKRSRDERTGTDIYEENGHTVFGQWIDTLPGERSSVGIRYVLPFRIRPETQDAGLIASFIRALRDEATFIPYDLAIVRQPGVKSTFTSTVTSPPAWEVAWRYPMTATTSPSTIQFSENFIDDLWFGVVWRPQ